MSLRNLKQKLWEPIQFVLIVISSAWIMHKWWGLMYDASYIGGICLAFIWFLNRKISRLNGMINGAIENLHKYMKSSYDFAMAQRESYIAISAKQGIKTEKIRRGMLYKEVEEEIRKLVLKEVQEERSSDEEYVKDMLGVCSKWERQVLMGAERNCLSAEAFSDSLFYVDTKKTEGDVLLVDHLHIPQEYIRLKFKFEKLVDWEIQEE